MTIFTYKAVDDQGTTHKGVLEADNPRHLRQQLRLRGLVPVTFHAGNARLSLFFGRSSESQKVFPSKALTRFTRELSILIEGGLPLEKALTVLATQTSDLHRRERILSLHAQVVEGISFANSLRKYPEDFPAFYCATITAGERAGDLQGVLGKLADYGENHLRTITKVKQAMIYPAIIAMFAVVAVMGLMIYVFPDISKVFAQSGQTLPLITRTLMMISDGLRHYGLVFAGILLIIFFIAKQSLNNPDVKIALHRRILKLPVISQIALAVDMVRFTSTLSMLRVSGVPLSEALTITSGVLNNLWLQKQTERVTTLVIEGSSLSQAMSQVSGYPPSLISIINGGEASGELDRVLQLSSLNQMRELENKVLFGVAILEPVIILGLGLVILLIVLAIMLPILSINQLVK